MKCIAQSIFFLFAAVIAAFAQDSGFKPMKDIAGFTTKFDAASKKLTTINSDFIQEKHLSMMESEIKSNGKFKYKKENKVRLEYTSPFQYLMVLNNGKMYIKDGKKVNKFDTNSNKMFRQINDMMVSTLRGDVLHSKNYAVTYFENETHYLLELNPQEKAIKEMMQTIKIQIEKKKLFVTSIQMMEPSGDFTKMLFQNITQNATLNDADFMVK